MLPATSNLHEINSNWLISKRSKSHAKGIASSKYKKIKKEARTKQLLGALLIAGAIVAGSRDSNAARAMAPAMAVIGGQVFISGWNVSKESQMHSAAIEELSESFGIEMQPVTMEFEGQQYELTGSAEEQFKHWRELLKQIYIAETGFDPAPTPEAQEMD